jgi:hypothetical protein
MVCGMVTIDVEMLRTSAIYEGCSATDRHVGCVVVTFTGAQCPATQPFAFFRCASMGERGLEFAIVVTGMGLAMACSPVSTLLGVGGAGSSGKRSL